MELVTCNITKINLTGIAVLCFMLEIVECLIQAFFMQAMFRDLNQLPSSGDFLFLFEAFATKPLK
jgi:hypothetical protein